jgi:hypothetical protein
LRAVGLPAYCLDKEEHDRGFDARSGEFKDLVKAGSRPSTSTILQSAMGFAALNPSYDPGSVAT